MKPYVGQAIIGGLLAALFLPAVAMRAASLDEPAVTNKRLAQVIRANDLPLLKILLVDASQANAADSLKNTPLHYAAIYGTTESMRLLLSKGADPKLCNQAGASALTYAAWNFEKTKLLVDAGASVNQAQADGVTPLIVAASTQGNLVTVQYLISKGADVNAAAKDHSTALLRAAGMADVETAKYLVSKGADVKSADAAGFTPLLSATAFAGSERLNLLLAAGATPNVFNTFGGQVRKGPIALKHLSPLMLAAPYGGPEAVDALLKAGSSVNEVDIRKMNALMLSIATDQANPIVVKKLIAAGADVNAKDQNGESVLTWARKFQNPEILTILENAGAQGDDLRPAPQIPAGSAAASASDAIHRAMPLLTRSGSQFFQEGGCAGCHHQPSHAQAFAAIDHSGLQPETALRTAFSNAMLVTRPRVVPGLPALNAPPGDYDTLLSYLMSMADLGEPANDFTDLIVHYVAVRQDLNGSWVNLGIARPPIEDSTLTRTADAIRAMKAYAWPARQPEFAERIRRARSWLEQTHPVNSYEQAEKILGLQAAGASPSQLASEGDALLKLQRADGGWAQTPYLQSDAYATGLALHTLYATGLAAPSDPADQKGVSFLLHTQFPDGSWYVRSRAPKFQPYFQSGFPFDHDQWISSIGTSYALMALAPVAAPANLTEAKPAR